MKFTIIMFIILLVGCSSQGNKNQTTQVPKQTIKTIPAKQQPRSTQAVALSKPSPPSTSSKPSTPSPKPAPQAAKPTVKKEVKKKVIYKDQYACEIDTIYKVHSAQSMKTDIGNLDLKLNGKTITLKVSNTKMNETYEIPLKSRSAFNLIAVGKGMVFSYNMHAQKFMFNTGIGAARFNLSAGGHQGKQMRLSGTCS